MKLLFKAEGIPEEYTVPVLLDLREQSSFEDQIAIAIPEDAIEGSINIRASVIGRTTVVNIILVRYQYNN